MCVAYNDCMLKHTFLIGLDSNVHCVSLLQGPKFLYPQRWYSVIVGVHFHIAADFGGTIMRVKVRNFAECVLK